MPEGNVPQPSRAGNSLPPFTLSAHPAESDQPAVSADQWALIQSDLNDADEVLTRSQAPNTKRAYGAAWRDFEAYCFSRGLGALPARPETVAAYLLALRKGTWGSGSNSLRSNFAGRQFSTNTPKAEPIQIPPLIPS